MWFKIGLYLSGWCRKMHLCVDYFVTDSPAHSPGNVWRGSDFNPDFLTVPKERRMLRNEIIKVGCLFTFLIGEWQILPLTDRKKSKQCPGKICRCSNSAFLHGVEWDRLIVHRTYKREGEKNENLCKTVIFQWIRMKFRTQIRNQNRNNLTLFLEEI